MVSGSILSSAFPEFGVRGLRFEVLVRRAGFFEVLFNVLTLESKERCSVGGRKQALTSTVLGRSRREIRSASAGLEGADAKVR